MSALKLLNNSNISVILLLTFIDCFLFSFIFLVLGMMSDLITASHSDMMGYVSCKPFVKFAFSEITPPGEEVVFFSTARRG